MKTLSRFSVILLMVSAIGPAWAESGIQLDPARISALAALPALEGAPVTAEALIGKYTAVTFFASWCPPCTDEFRHLKDFRARHPNEVVVVAVNIHEDFDGKKDPGRLKRFLEKADPSFFLLGEGEEVSDLFGEVSRIPTLFLFDGDGRPAMHFIHERGATKMFTTPEELEAAFASIKTR